MFKCHHCHDLHVSSDQARECATSDGEWFEEALQEVDRILERGPIPWTVKKALRDETDWTMPERQLWNALNAVLPGEIRSQWWIPGCDYRVDLYVPSVSLAIEVDGPSHSGRAGPDRLRSSVLRSNGVTVLRIPNALAMSESEQLAALVAERVRAEVPAPVAAMSA